MRVAATIIGGLGALVDMARGVVSAGGWLFVGAMMGDLTNSVSLLLIGTAGTIAVFSTLGKVGAGLVFAGARLRAGALLLLIGALGVAAATAAYPLLLSVIMAPVVNATGIPTDYPDADYYAVSLAPAVALLIGATLAFFARGGSEDRYGSSQTPA